MASPAAFVAPPSDYEARWKAVKAAGGNAGAHWAAVGPTAFNTLSVVLPALERLEDKTASNAARDLNKSLQFDALRESAGDIINDMIEEQMQSKGSPDGTSKCQA